jgi:carbonic anhydrase
MQNAASKFKTLFVCLTTTVLSLHPGFAFAANGSSAKEALNQLIAGNDRYMKGKSIHPRFEPVERERTAREGQAPIATVLGCSDARVPPEVVFDQGFGQLFIVRVAGNVCSTAELASIEYGVKYLKTPLIVVLGHTKCGAVNGALSGQELKGSLPKLMALITPALTSVQKSGLKGDALERAAVEANVKHTIDEILAGSPGLAEKVKSGQIIIVGAVRDISKGNVVWLDSKLAHADASKPSE